MPFAGSTSREKCCDCFSASRHSSFIFFRQPFNEPRSTCRQECNQQGRGAENARVCTRTLVPSKESGPAQFALSGLWKMKYQIEVGSQRLRLCLALIYLFISGHSFRLRTVLSYCPPMISQALATRGIQFKRGTKRDRVDFRHQRVKSCELVRPSALRTKTILN